MLPPNASGGIPVRTPVFRRRRFFSGKPAGPDGSALRDIIWFTPAGTEMTLADWRSAFARSLGVFLNGNAITEPGPRGEAITDSHFLLLFNAHSEPVPFALPGPDLAPGWEVVVDTADPAADRLQGAGTGQAPGGTLLVRDRAIVVLRAVAGT